MADVALVTPPVPNADGTYAKDPMHGEPLQLVPEEHRAFRDAFRREAVLAGGSYLSPAVLSRMEAAAA